MTFIQMQGKFEYMTELIINGEKSHNSFSDILLNLFSVYIRRLMCHSNELVMIFYISFFISFSISFFYSGYLSIQIQE